MAETTIEWATHTWNPVTGCDRVSPGCKHCYALDLAARLKAMGQARYQRDGTPPTSGPGFGLTLHPDRLVEPLSWRKPRMVFVNSMSDLFHPEIPDEYIADVWWTMARAPQHTFQVLTKRPERMAEWVSRCARAEAWISHNGRKASKGGRFVADLRETTWPLPNVWLGTSIESRTYVGRADHLRATPAAVRFISAEPLLGPLVWTERTPGSPDDWLNLEGIDWLIVGGESGPNARRMDPEWARDLRDATRCELCDDGDYRRGQECLTCGGTGRTGPAFFFKQWGGRTPKAGGRELDGRTWDEFPGPPTCIPLAA